MIQPGRNFDFSDVDVGETGECCDINHCEAVTREKWLLGQHLIQITHASDCPFAILLAPSGVLVNFDIRSQPRRCMVEICRGGVKQICLGVYPRLSLALIAPMWCGSLAAACSR
jgi:hypothetical protein